MIVAQCAPVDMQEEIPFVLRWREHGPTLRGWLAAEFDKSIGENPHEPESAEWHEWRAGWFARNRGEDAVYQPETWAEVPQD